MRCPSLVLVAAGGVQQVHQATAAWLGVMTVVTSTENGEIEHGMEPNFRDACCFVDFLVICSFWLVTPLFLVCHTSNIPGKWKRHISQFFIQVFDKHLDLKYQWDSSLGSAAKDGERQLSCGLHASRCPGHDRGGGRCL